MEEFPSNTRKPEKSEERTPRVEKVISGEVVTRKPPLGRRFKDTFVGGDRANVWEYVLLDVVVPAVKDMLVDAGQQAIEKMIFGETRPGSRRPGYRAGSTGSHFNYAGISKTSRPDPRRDLSREARSNHSFQDIIFEKRHQGEEVLDKMYELLEKYELVTVQDLYDACGVTSNFTDAKYGWDDLQGSRVDRTHGGYLLNLPRPEPVK